MSFVSALVDLSQRIEVGLSISSCLFLDLQRDLGALHDPAHLREILKQHPQLVAVLKARLGQATVAQDP